MSELNKKEEIKLKNVPKNTAEQSSLNKTANAVVKKRFGFANKFTFFLGGMGLTFSVLYFHFMNYIQKSDEMIKNDIEEIKRMIERDNLLKGAPKIITKLENMKSVENIPTEINPNANANKEKENISSNENKKI